MGFGRIFRASLVSCFAACGSGPTVPPASQPVEWRAPAERSSGLSDANTSEDDGRRGEGDAGADGVAADAASECRDVWSGDDLARLSCDASQVRLRHEVAFNPAYRVPKEPARSVIRAVGQIMRDDPSILLIRIEVATHHDPGKSTERARAAIVSTQRRADAVFRQLWRREGVSAERMEALGVGYSSGAAKDRRFTTRVVIVQRR